MRAGNPRVRAAILAGLLIALWLMVEIEVSPLLAWTDRCFPISRYPWLFASYFATWAALRWAGDRTRRPILLAGSLVTGLVFDPGFVIAALLWVLALHRILFGGSPRRVGYALAFTGATFAGLGVFANYDLFPDLLAAHPFVARWAYVFVLSFVFRLAWLFHEVRLCRIEHLPAIDVVLYFLFAPFFVIVPYMLAIPRCARFRADLDRHDPAIERSGLALVGYGIALSCALAALRAGFDVEARYAAALASRDLAGILLYSPLHYPLVTGLHAIAIGAILVGLVRVLGFGLGPSFDRPLSSPDIAEWWRRWNIHFRDLLVELFYNPVALRLRRQPRRAIVFGCMSVFLIGSVVFHVPKHYLKHGSLEPVPLWLLVENLALCVIVSIALLRARRARPTQRRWPRVALGIATTWLLVLLANVYLGGASQALVQSSPTTPARWSLEFERRGAP